MPYKGMRAAITNAVSALLFLKVLSDVLSAWLPKDRQDRIREVWGRLQTEWETEGIEKFTTIALRSLGSIYDDILGQRPFSGRSFLRCLFIAPLLLGACLGLSGIWLKLPFAMR